MKEFERKSVKFKIDGGEYTVSFPTVGQLNEFSRDSKDSENGFESTIDFLVKLGLKKKIAESLEAEHYEWLVGELSNAKKT